MNYIELAKFLSVSLVPVLMLGLVFYIFRKNKKKDTTIKNNLLDK